MKLAFIGAGNMAGAILKGLVEQGYGAENIQVSDLNVEQVNKLQSQYPALKIGTDNAQAVAEAEVVILAVKPQVMSEVCKTLEIGNKLVISIAAGISVARLEELTGASRVVRVMPNTPCLIGKGMSGLFAKNSVNQADKDQAQALMSAVGKTAWVSEESQMNAVIAASGSAPAYFFLFMQAMQKSAETMGLSAEAAREFVQQAAVGSCMLAAQNSTVSFEELTAQVTSKGGTTAKAVDAFAAGDLNKLVDCAMQACVARAQEMESQF